FGQPLPPGSVVMSDGAAKLRAGDLVDGKSNTIHIGEMTAGGLKGALLSLAMDLPVSAESARTAFKYTGAPGAGEAPSVQVEYRNRRPLSFVSRAWPAGVVLVFWFARRWSVGTRAALAVLGLAAPLALAPVVPLDLLPYLDGLFLGTVWGLVLWILLAF